MGYISRLSLKTRARMLRLEERSFNLGQRFASEAATRAEVDKK